MICDVHIFFRNSGNVELGGNLLRREQAQNTVVISASIAATLTLVPSGESLNSILYVEEECESYHSLSHAR